MNSEERAAPAWQAGAFADQGERAARMLPRSAVSGGA